MVCIVLMSTHHCQFMVFACSCIAKKKINFLLVSTILVSPYFLSVPILDYHGFIQLEVAGDNHIL